MDDLKTLHERISFEERLARLNKEQQAIVIERQEKSARMDILIAKMSDPDPDVHEGIFNAMRDMYPGMCEHDRPSCKHCIECADIDHLMYPEVFNEFGEYIEDENEEIENEA